jgi:hypothetical protein
MHWPVPLPIVKRAGASQDRAMHASIALVLSPEDKLDLLRNLDEFHFWHSLDDKRSCKRCGRSITGRQILILALKGTRGRLRLQCPTVGCVSTSSEWIYADPVLAARLRTDFRPATQRFKEQAPEPRLTHHGRACTVRRASYGRDGKARSKRNQRQWAPRGEFSLRKAAARLPILRSLVTGLHAIHPVA